LGKLVEHILGSDVRSVHPRHTGEPPSLSCKLRYELIDCVCKLVNNRVSVLVGITDTSHIESIKIAEYSQKQGVSAVVLAPPYYFQTGQPKLLEYIEHLAPKFPLPFFCIICQAARKFSLSLKLLLKTRRYRIFMALKIVPRI
jgi:4-hydroxy-tetrahydrodipicolinate synthase